MKYGKGLFISLLLHGLAFAGTNWITSLETFKGKSARFQTPVYIQVEWENSTCSKPIPSIPTPPKKGLVKEIQITHIPNGFRNLDSKIRIERPECTKVYMRTRESTIFENQISKDEGYTPARPAEKPTTLKANPVLVPHPDNPVPVYPEQARIKGLKGEMTLTLTIDTTGHVVKIDIQQGNALDPLLKEAAVEAIKKWRFIRSDKSTKPLSVTLPVVFDLES